MGISNSRVQPHERKEFLASLKKHIETKGETGIEDEISVVNWRSVCDNTHQMAVCTYIIVDDTGMPVITYRPWATGRSKDPLSWSCKILNDEESISLRELMDGVDNGTMKPVLNADRG